MVLRGELWIRRTLTNQILNELVKVTHEKILIEQAVNDLLENLTRREYEFYGLSNEYHIIKSP